MNSKAQTQIEMIKARLDETLDYKAFMQGLAAVGGLWLLLIIFMATQSGAVKEKMQEKLAIQTVMIERDLDNVSLMPSMAMPKQGASHAQAAGGTIDPLMNRPMPIIREGLAKAPIQGLVEISAYGELPQIRSTDGLTPFEAYKRSFSFAEHKPPYIALVVRNFGLSQNLAMKATQELPKQVTFLVNPYATASQEVATLARHNGFETWAELPVELKDYEEIDTGPKTLMALNSLNDNIETLNWLMARHAGYAGVMAHFDGAFDSAGSMLEKLIGLIYGRGVGFADANPDAPGMAQRLAILRDAPYARNSLVINDPAQFEQLEVMAVNKGFAMGIIPISLPHLGSIKAWLDTLESKGITLVPASAITEAPAQLMGQANPSITGDIAPPPSAPALSEEEEHSH